MGVGRRSQLNQNCSESLRGKASCVPALRRRAGGCRFPPPPAPNGRTSPPWARKGRKILSAEAGSRRGRRFAPRRLLGCGRAGRAGVRGASSARSIPCAQHRGRGRPAQRLGGWSARKRNSSAAASLGGSASESSLLQQRYFFPSPYICVYIYINRSDREAPPDI